MQMLVKATLGSGENACENILQTMVGMDNVPNQHLGVLQHHHQLICMLLSDSGITWLMIVQVRIPCPCSGSGA